MRGLQSSTQERGSLLARSRAALIARLGLTLTIAVDQHRGLLCCRPAIRGRLLARLDRPRGRVRAGAQDRHSGRDGERPYRRDQAAARQARPARAGRRLCLEGAPARLQKGYMESYKAEIAAYELDKMLGLQMVPPIVERTVDGEKGAAIYWIENTTGWDVKNPPQGPEPTWSRQLTRMKMFDLLVANIDRNQGNLIYDADWHLFLIDHSRAFIDKKDLKGIAAARYVDRAVDAMQALTFETLKAGLGEWVERRRAARAADAARGDGQGDREDGGDEGRRQRLRRLVAWKRALATSSSRSSSARLRPAGQAPRIVGVGDIHGDVDELHQHPATGRPHRRGRRWVGRPATLDADGRLPGSRGDVRAVLDLLMALEVKARAGRPRAGAPRQPRGDEPAGLTRDATPAICEVCRRQAPRGAWTRPGRTTRSWARLDGKGRDRTPAGRDARGVRAGASAWLHRIPARRWARGASTAGGCVTSRW